MLDETTVRLRSKDDAPLYHVTGNWQRLFNNYDRGATLSAAAAGWSNTMNN